ncbi:hypothetical protein PYW07_006163 [Mythimna separata]|uniref:Uncharacterized protein n=1 Tax=Mythimna separata TaxID=271217 RepID=A0AAD7YLC3_MYTSE|nr:hypothetical protein PYW07_006163 [Mythimna separata]
MQDYVVAYKGTEPQCQRAEKEVPGRRRSAVGDSAGDMQAAPARYVSVSELYSTDEVELLLDEIRELEPTSCRGEDVQLCSVSACACVWAGVGLRVGRVPLAPRVRLLLLAALSSLLLHSALLVLHVTRLAALLPLDWNKLGAWTSVWSALSLGAGGALTLHAVLAAPEYRWAPAPLASLLVAGAALGLGGAGVAGALAAGGARGWLRRRAAARARASWSARSSSGSPRAAYRAVPAAPPPAPVASTSRDDPL